MVSSKARNQRKMRANAPAHIKRKMLSSHLSADLQKEYGKRSARVCLGDTVMVLRGGEDIRGVEGKVIGVMTDEGRITIEGDHQSGRQHSGRTSHTRIQCRHHQVKP